MFGVLKLAAISAALAAALVVTLQGSGPPASSRSDRLSPVTNGAGAPASPGDRDGLRIAGAT